MNERKIKKIYEIKKIAVYPKSLHFFNIPKVSE